MFVHRSLQSESFTGISILDTKTCASKFSYRIIKFVSFFGALTEIVVYKDCKKNVKFEEEKIRGLRFKVVVACHCSRRLISSRPFINNEYEINRLKVFTMLLLGVAHR